MRCDRIPEFCPFAEPHQVLGDEAGLCPSLCRYSSTPSPALLLHSMARGAADEDAFEHPWEGLKPFDTSKWTVYFQNVKQLCEKDYPEGCFPVVLTFLSEWLIPTRAWGEEAKPFSCCHWASSGLCPSKAINSSLWPCRWLCHLHLLGHFSRQTPEDFPSPYLWTTVMVQALFSCLSSRGLTPCTFCPSAVTNTLPWLWKRGQQQLKTKMDCHFWTWVAEGSCSAAGDKGRRGSYGCLSWWEFSNPLTQLIDDSLEKQPHSSPTLPVKDVFPWGISFAAERLLYPFWGFLLNS